MEYTNKSAISSFDPWRLFGLKDYFGLVRGSRVGEFENNLQNCFDFWKFCPLQNDGKAHTISTISVEFVP